MLLGKAQFQKGDFDEAAATFSYMSHVYQTQIMENGLARAWLAKCYTELDWLYDAEDVIRNMSRDSIHFRAVKDWDYTYADYYIRTKDYQKAVPYLQKVIKHEKRHQQKAREWYLMGQIQKELGNRREAERAFGKVVGCHPSYELEFNARIAQTEVMASGNAKGMISRLKRMAANDNNKEYLDQVYYAMGNIYLMQKDTMKAVGAYEKGNKKATRSGIEKGVLLLTLGNLYWQLEKYNDAQRCYGEAIGLLDKDRKDYAELSQRSKVLDELVPFTDAIHLQDSLLELSTMPEADRLKAIDRVIAELKKKEKEAREAELEQAAERMQQKNAAVGNRNKPAAPTAPTAGGNGQWYFYNPTAVNQGKTAFQRLWGRRENADNWQRLNQTVVNLGGDAPESAEDQEKAEGGENPENPEIQENPESPDTPETAQADSLANDPHNREYYLAQIPFTDEQKEASHAIIQESLLKAGIIFKDKLDNLNLSEKHLLRLTKDYPNYEQMADAWYHLFLLYSRQGRHTLADNCLSHLKAEHPESEWTTLLSDPYYASNAKFGAHIEDSLYAATYEAFKNDKYDAVKSNTRMSAERFPMGEHRAKFIFIEGLSLLNEGDGTGCVERLKEVVEKFPKSEVSELAGMIVKGVQEGRRLHGGKFDIGDVWSRRDITLAADSTVADTLSADPNQHFLFILAYEPDSVDQNQLLFEVARYNFTNFLVRNFEISTDQDEGLQRMIISGFQNYDEALQYARQLYADENMAEKVEKCRSLIISDVNFSLLGTRFSYEDYELFYEDIFVPMKVSQEQLLIRPEDLEAPDIEDVGGPRDTDSEEEEEGEDEDEDEVLPGNKKQEKKTVDFDFGDDFW